MSRKPLTDLTVQNAKSTAAQTEFFDTLCPGLALRVTLQGKKTWAFSFTSPRDQKRARMTLGTYPAMSLLQARTAATEKRELIGTGRDPRDVLPAPVLALKLVRELAADRLSMEVWNPADPLRSAGEIQRTYNVNILPIIGHIPVTDFRIRHLNLCIDPLLTRGKRRQAEKVFVEMKTLFKFAVRRGEVEYSTIAEAGLPKMHKVPKTRAFDITEIAQFWEWLPDAFETLPEIADVLKLCLILGQRLDEVCGMARWEIAAKERVWTIPKERVKNKHDHPVPLPDMAWEIIEPRLRASNSGYVFPHNQTADRPISGNHVTSACGYRRRKGLFNVARWSPHDLRRTVATQMSISLDMSDFMIGLVLNHRSTTKNSITSRVYNQNTHIDKKRDALDKWAAFLANVIAGGKVVQIEREAA